MIESISRLWKLPEPTGDEIRREATQRTMEQVQFAKAESEHHQTHREQNHFSERFRSVFEEEARWGSH